MKYFGGKFKVTGKCVWRNKKTRQKEVTVERENATSSKRGLSSTDCFCFADVSPTYSILRAKFILITLISSPNIT